MSRLSNSLLAALGIAAVGCGPGNPRNKPAPVVTGLNPAAAVASTGGSAESGGAAKPASTVTAWGTIKGRIVWDGEIPAAKTLEAAKDREHCEKEGKVPDETLVVDAKTKGVRDVYVFIRQPAGIHPSLPKDAASAGAAFDAEFQKANGFPRKELTSKLKGGTKANTVKAPMLVDQVFCKYVPHAAAIQEGQPLLVLNPEPVAHNIKLTSQSGSNDFNITMPVNSAEQLTLKAEAGAIAMGCTIHPWMVGSLMVFDHPYFAVTKADGSFEIKNAPAGDNNLVIVVPGGVGAVDASSGGKGSARGSKITVPANGEAGIGQGGELKVRK